MPKKKLLIAAALLGNLFAIAQSPTISSFSPTTANSATNVFINGNHFNNATAVKFGDVPAASFTVFSNTTIMARPDTGSRSGYVTVETPLGSGSLWNFVFLPPPVLNSFSPTTGSMGTLLTLRGNRFSTVTAVSIGNVPVQSFSILSDTVLTALAGPGASGAVRIQSPGGSASLNGFTHQGPLVSSYAPVSGPPGTIVTIRGRNFTGANAVQFQGSAAASFTILSDSVIAAVTAPGNYGFVSVTSPAGSSGLGGFNLPFISSFDPTFGGYNTTVTIRGYNFTGATAVSFGDTAALGFTVLSDTVITARTGPGLRGNIKVLNQFGFGQSSIRFYFEYQQPVIDSLSPLSGGQGTAVTIFGKKFSGTNVVRFGFTDATSINVLNDSTIRAVIGQGSSGIVSVRNADSYSTTSSQTFAFTGPRVSSINPWVGLPGDTVLIAGENFNNVTAVSIGTVPASYYIVLSPSSIKAVVGPGLSGPVTVTTPLGTFVGSRFDMRPLLQSFAPNMAGKDTVVTLMGRYFTGASSVKFGTVNAASFTVLSDTLIRAVVPQNSGSGTVNVSTPGGTASLTGFTFVPAPTLTYHFPNQGGKDSVIYLQGTNLQFITEVRFGGLPLAAFTILSPTEMRATLDTGAVGPISVKSIGGIATRTGFTYYKPPVFTSFSPANAGPMDVVTIRGNNLQIAGAVGSGQLVGNGLLKVNFGGTDMIWVHSISDTLLRVSPGKGSSGSITVRTPGGATTLPGFTYIVIPTIQTFTPASGPVGSTVTITGSNFSPIADSNSVFFGNAKAKVLTATATQLTVAVPAGAGFEPISVTVGNKTAFCNKPFVLSFPGAADFSALTFKEKKVIPTGYLAWSSFFADLNGDGRAEMIICKYNVQEVLIYPNLSTPGDLQFGNPIQLNTGRVGGSYAVKAKDLDGDGKPEICFVDGFSGGAVAVWRNTSDTAISFLNIQPYPGFTFMSDSDADLCVADINRDGKPDLLSGVGGFSSSSKFNIRLNISAPGGINFNMGGTRFFTSGFTGFFLPRVNSIAPTDFDNDGLSDLLVGYAPYGSTFGQRRISVLRNVNTPQYNDSYYPWFESLNLTMSEGFNNFSYRPYAGDLNGDSLPDILVANYAFINTGNLSFNGPQPFNDCVNCEFVTDMDGDGKPDLARAVNDSFIIVRNRSAAGTINLAPRVAIPSGIKNSYFTVGDLDGDGKPEVLLTSLSDSFICILRNKSGEQVKLCPDGSVTLTSNLTGNSYQWQVDKGNGFVNLTGNATANQLTLQLPNQPDSAYGYRYRCIADNQYGYIYSLVFENRWTGAVDNTWENAGNWSCGSVPTRFTDVVIGSGNVVVNSNVTIRSLTVSPGSNFTVMPGFVLTITN